MLLMLCLLCGLQFSGRVVDVLEGDVVQVEWNHQRSIIRLSEINAPPLGTSFGDLAKKILMEKLLGKRVTVVWDGIGKKQRLRGTLVCEGENINHWLVRTGLVYHFKEVSHSEGFAKYEKEAMNARRGLWRGDILFSDPETWVDVGVLPLNPNRIRRPEY